jgi:hypothetical protein
MSIFRRIVIIKRNIADQICRQNHKRQFIFNNFVFEYHTVCQIMWQNVEQPDGEHKMRFARWLDKAIDKHSEYVEHADFSRQYWLHNRTTILRLYYIVILFWVCL